MNNIFLTPRQAAQILNVSLSTLKKFIYSGQIKTLKTPGGHHRIRRRDLFQMVGPRPSSRRRKTKLPLLTILLIISIIGLGCPAQSAYAFSYKGLDFKLHTDVSTAYDGNVSLASQDEKQDLVANLSLGLGLSYEAKARSLELAANVSQQLFADNDNYNNTSEALTVDFQQELSKFDRFSLNNVFSHTYEPGSFEEAFGRTAGRYSYFRNRFNFAYTKDITKQFSVAARYTNELDEISREDLNDSSLNGAGLEAVYFLSSASILLFSYNFSKRDFDPGNSASMQTIASGIRHYFTKQLYFDGQAGVNLVDSYTENEHKKPLIQASLTSEIDENSRAAISFAKRYYTNSYSEDVFDYWQGSASYTSRLSPRLAVSVSGFYGNGEYVMADVTDKLKGATVGLSYDLNKKTKLKLNYTYSRVDSTLASREYSRNRTMLALAMEF